MAEEALLLAPLNGVGNWYCYDFGFPVESIGITIRE
jgi:hypothetical protein